MDAAAGTPLPRSHRMNSAGQGGAKSFLVGGGIGSLAAAAFMVRDGGVPGRSTTILEGLGTLGGSLDGAGSPEHGYVLRGGRMLEGKYLCTFGLLADIPAQDGERSVTQEIEAWIPLLPLVVGGMLAAAVALALVLGLVKIPVFARLGIA